MFTRGTKRPEMAGHIFFERQGSTSTKQGLKDFMVLWKRNTGNDVFLSTESGGRIKVIVIIERIHHLQYMTDLKKSKLMLQKRRCYFFYSTHYSSCTKPGALPTMQLKLGLYRFRCVLLLVNVACSHQPQVEMRSGLHWLYTTWYRQTFLCKIPLSKNSKGSFL